MITFDRSVMAGAMVFVFTIGATTPGWACGRLGHRVIARLAEKHMTPEAKAGVAALLESGESIGDFWSKRRIEC